MNAALIGDTVDAMALICDPDKEAKKEESEELEISMKMATVMCWEGVSEAYIHDKETQEIVRAVKSGFPEKRDECSEHLKKVWHCHDEFYQLENVPMLNNQMFIPKAL